MLAWQTRISVALAVPKQTPAPRTFVRRKPAGSFTGTPCSARKRSSHLDIGADHVCLIGQEKLRLGQHELQDLPVILGEALCCLLQLRHHFARVLKGHLQAIQMRVLRDCHHCGNLSMLTLPA